MKRDTILREEGEVGVGRIINKRRRDKAAHGGDKRRRPAVGPLGNNKPAQKRAIGARNVNRGIGMNINIVQI